MKRIVDIINLLPKLLPLKPASDIQINDAENQLGIKFADEYKEYLSAFGAIMADGFELTGIAKSEYRNVVNVTRKERELNPKVPNTMYVIEDAQIDGIIIWQDTNGVIYKTQYDTEPEKIAESMAEYLAG